MFWVISPDQDLREAPARGRVPHGQEQDFPGIREDLDQMTSILLEGTLLPFLADGMSLPLGSGSIAFGIWFLGSGYGMDSVVAVI